MLDMHIILRTSTNIFILNVGLLCALLFWERYILKCQIVFEGHWRIQSWTLILLGVSCSVFHFRFTANRRITRITLPNTKSCRWLIFTITKVRGCYSVATLRVSLHVGCCPLDSNNTLHRLWRPLIHKSHIECTSPSRSKSNYMLISIK